MDVSSSNVASIYVKSTGSDTSGNGTYFAPYATIEKAFAKIPANTEATIFVLDDLTVDKINTMNTSKTAIIKGQDGVKTLKRGIAFKDNSLFDVTNSTVIFEDITIDGANVESQAGLIYIYNGKVVLGNNTTLQNNNNQRTTESGYSQSSAGAVVINNASSILVMEAGSKITHNTGRNGAVFNHYAGQFIMNGGQIVDNTTITNGLSAGVFLYNNTSTFEFNGGVIARNTKGSDKSNVYLGSSNATIKLGDSPNFNGTPKGLHSIQMLLEHKQQQAHLLQTYNQKM